MPPKTDQPKGATTRAAAAKQEDTSSAPAAEPAADPLLSSPSMAERMERLLATVEHLAGLPDQVSDLCSRMAALELRSGRTSPSKTPPASSAAVSNPASTAIPAAAAAPSRSSAVTQPPPATASPEVATSQPATAMHAQTSSQEQGPGSPQSPAQSSGQTVPDPSRARSWRTWPADIQTEMRFRLGKQGLTLTQLFEESDDPSVAVPAATRDPSAVPSSRPLLCKHETLGSFDGDPAKLESFLSRVRAIGRKRIPGWEDAVLAAVPDALSGHAAKWHASLTDKETAALSTLDALMSAMRRAFPINRAQLRSLARQRKWEPKEESAMNYYYDKVLLLRQAFGDTYSEKALAQDVADGLDASMRGYVRLPTENPTLQKLQDAMAEWEPVWREVHAVSLASASDDTTHAPGMIRSRSEPATPNTTAPPTAPLPPPPARPPRSEQRQQGAPPVAPRQTSASVGSLSQSYDASRVVPASNGQPRMYRIPDSSRIMRLNRNCNKCGQAHFDFEHEHLLASGQIRVVEAAPYDELDESELDSAFVQSF